MTRSPSPASAARCLVAALLLVVAAQQCSAAYYGKLIGKLSQLHHGVSGEVYAVDARTLFIKDFTYDGEGPAAFFYAGTTKSVGTNGFKVRDERGTFNVLKRYRKRDITLTLPEGKTLNNVKWFSVYCDEYAVNFGDVKIPRNFDYPRPQKLGSLSGIHGVNSEPVVVVDAQTLLVPSFSYDGEAPDAKFWVGVGPSPSPQGIRVPDENGKEVPLRRYDRKTIVLTLPGDLTVHQLGHFGVWCEAFAVDFGHVTLPQSLNVPPSLKMLGVSPQSKLNCEVLDDGLAFEVRWAVAGDSIVVQLVGKLEDNQYMSFGLSADSKRSIMVGGDVVVAWVDKQTLQGYAVDYFLDAKSQCSGGRGSCPDVKVQENTNSVRLLNAAMVNGYSIVTYQRSLKASDELDRPILTNSSQAIIWAVGPLNDKSEVSFHSNYLKGDQLIEFGRPPAWNCPMPEVQNEKPQKEQPQQQPQQQQTHQKLVAADNSAAAHQVHRDQESSQLPPTTRRPQRLPATPAPASTANAWEIPPIQCFEPEDGVFYAQMGPTGGKHGYPAITGHVGWGIAWYINGLLIPEIHVVRGKQYTFVVEGGDDAETPARYHPFYITDDSVGGYQHKSPEERANVTIFAGVRRQRGVVRPTGVGRLCNWVPDQKQPPADEFSSFGAYQRTLTLECDPGDPGVVEWTPDKDTPDTVYYQCFTHRYLGWKIHVHDTCDSQKAAASEQHAVVVEPSADADIQQQQSADLEPEASIRANPSKVTPSPEFFQRHQEYSSQDYDYLRNQAINQPSSLHHHHQLHHHPQTATNNNPAKLITGPYMRDHYQPHYHYNHYHNYNRNVPPPPPPQLTLMPSSYLDQHIEDQRRSPTKLTYDAINYIIQRESNNNNNNDYNHHYHHHHAHPTHYHHQLASPPSLASYAVQEPSSSSSSSSSYASATEAESQSTEPTSPDLQYPKLVADHHQVMRRPAASVLVNQVVAGPGSPMRVSYSVPAASPNNLIYTRTQQQQQQQAQNSMRMQPPPPPQQQQIMIVPKRSQVPPPPAYYQTALRRHPQMTGSMVYQQQQQQATGANSMVSVARPPVFYERKKAVYKDRLQGPMISRMQTLGKQAYHRDHYYHHQPTKLMKVDLKQQQQRAKIEAKVAQSEALSSEHKPSLMRPLMMKPARNTGFDPGSIVIEKGFKPILKRNSNENTNNNNDNSNNNSGNKHLEQRSLEMMMQDEEIKETASDRYNDSFEPVFIPSPPDRNGIKKQSKKKAQLVRTKLKLDSVDDMEMAAADRERLDLTYMYLPTASSATVYSKRSPKSSSSTHLSPVPSNSSMSSESQDDPKHSNSTLEVQSKTHESHVNSRHLMLKRTKRSAQSQMKSENWDATYRRSQDQDSHKDNARHDHDHDTTGHDDHNQSQKSHSNGHKPTDQTYQASTGEIILANVEYIVLTVILYYAL